MSKFTSDMDNETLFNAPLPDWAAGEVSINNRHHNLYGNYGNTGDVYLLDDGTFDYDGQRLGPIASLYVLEGGALVYHLTQVEIDQYAEDWRSYVDNMMDKSTKIDRSVGLEDVDIEAPADRLFASYDLECKRYPHASNPSEMMVYRELDRISDRHDPDAILTYLAYKHYHEHSHFVPGYLHIPAEQQVTPRLQAAILAYNKRGGILGRSALDALEVGRPGWLNTFKDQSMSVHDLTVDLQGNWAIWHAQPIPKGWRVLGTVTRGRGDTGALAQTPIGEYVQLNAGVVRTLDRHAVKRAMESQ